MNVSLDKKIQMGGQFWKQDIYSVEGVMFNKTCSVIQIT